MQRITVALLQSFRNLWKYKIIVQKINFELNLLPFLHFMCSYEIDYCILACLYNHSNIKAFIHCIEEKKTKELGDKCG